MKRFFPLLLASCSAVDGRVLIARDAQIATAPEDAGEVDAEAERDAQDDVRDAGAARDAGDPLEDAEPPTSPDTLGVCRVGGSGDGFYDTFDGSALDPATWLVAHGSLSFDGAPVGEFARDNVSVSGGALTLTVHGDRASARSAAAVATRDSFASGTYQVQGRFTGPSGVRVALWFMRDDDSAGAVSLGTPGDDQGTPSYAVVDLSTRDADSRVDEPFALGGTLDDGASHILRFDLYNTAQRAVSFWIDDAQRWETTVSLPPTGAGRLWIVAWAPSGLPADFERAEIRIENAFITPFGNDGDVCTDGELAGPFLELPAP